MKRVLLIASGVWACLGCGSDGGAPGSGGTGGSTAGAGGSAAGTSGSGGVTLDPGAVREDGPPCGPFSGVDLATSSQLLYESEDGDYSLGRIVASTEGVFWPSSSGIYRVALSGGTPEFVASGSYYSLFEDGTDLLVVGTSSVTGSVTAPAPIYEVAKTAAGVTPTAILTTTDGDQFFTFDATNLYVFNHTAMSLVAVARAGGARMDLAAGVDVSAAELFQDHLYFLNSTTDAVFRVPKTGGTAELVAQGFDIPWSLQPTSEALLVGAWHGLYRVPAGATTGQEILSVDGYVERVLPIADRIYVWTSDSHLSWVNAEGTRCQGLFSETFFFGEFAIFGDSVYIVHSPSLALAVRRLPLP